MTEIQGDAGNAPGEVPKTVTVGWPAAGRAQVDIPAAVGNVRLGREVGRGGMGVVLRGWDEVLHRQVAVKFLLGAAADKDDPQFARFFVGARAEAAVRHANIVPVHAAGRIDGVPYLVMEYIDGPTLREIIEKSAPLPPHVAVKVMWDVASGVAALHERELVHQDLKPGNVLFDQDGRLFVTDFGLASLRRRSEMPTPIAGTPAYMAPEMFHGNASPQSDVYAMGIMLFELLIGRLPFAGDLPTLRDQHAHAPLPVAELASSIPTSIVDIIERAAHKKEIFRYKRAEHFQRALRNSVATDEFLAKGTAELKNIVFALHGKESVEQPVKESEEPTTTTYFDRLAEIADQKRATREPSGEAVYTHPPKSPLGKGGLREVGAEASTLPPGDQPVEVGPIPGPPSAEPVRAATLVVDVPCAKCDYNLRGLSAGGRCPECGEGITSSLRPDRLLFAEPSWLRHMMRGLTVLYAGVAATPVLFLVGAAASSILSTGGMMASALAGVVLILGLVLGSFFATAAEPRRYGGSIRWSSRRVARTLGVLTPLLLAAIPFTANYSRVLLIVSLGLMGATFLGMIVTFLLYLASLADRIPHRRLARRSRGLALLAGALVTLGIADFLAVRVFAAGVQTDSVAFWATVVVATICVLGGGVTSVLIWVLMRLYRRTFVRAIAASVSYETLFGDVPTEVALPTSENDRAATRSPRAETGDTGGENTDVDEVPASDDIPCIHCGYNLRRLPEGGRCPECGTPIAQSSRGDLLSAADPAWLERVCRGQGQIAAACLGVWLVGNLDGDAFEAGPAGFIPFSLLVGPNTIRSVIFDVISAGFNLLLLLGAFAVTTLDPRLSLTEQPIALRRFVRWSLVTLVALAGSSYLVPTVVKQLGGDVEVAGLCGTVLLHASGLVFLSALVGICYYLAGLAMRIPDAKLATRVRSRVIGFVVFVVVCPVGIKVAEYGERALAGTPGVTAITVLFNLILVASATAYFCLLLYVMWAYQKAFWKCLLEARKYAAVQERPSGITRTIGRWFWND